MYYIIGSKKLRERFADQVVLPYFQWQEDTDSDTTVYSNDDNKCAMFINLTQTTPLYTVARFDGETGQYYDEFETDCYQEAVDKYVFYEQ